jgi:hypothetical protein
MGGGVQHVRSAAMTSLRVLSGSSRLCAPATVAAKAIASVALMR